MQAEAKFDCEVMDCDGQTFQVYASTSCGFAKTDFHREGTFAMMEFKVFDLNLFNEGDKKHDAYERLEDLPTNFRHEERDLIESRAVEALKLKLVELA